MGEDGGGGRCEDSTRAGGSPLEARACECLDEARSASLLPPSIPLIVSFEGGRGMVGVWDHRYAHVSLVTLEKVWG